VGDAVRTLAAASERVRQHLADACFACGRRGHYAKECPGARAHEEPQPEPAAGASVQSRHRMDRRALKRERSLDRRTKSDRKRRHTEPAPRAGGPAGGA